KKPKNRVRDYSGRLAKLVSLLLYQAKDTTTTNKQDNTTTLST
ncbi:unnamed protein product, partial [marine sediment metagenome]